MKKNVSILLGLLIVCHGLMAFEESGRKTPIFEEKYFTPEGKEEIAREKEETAKRQELIRESEKTRQEEAKNQEIAQHKKSDIQDSEFDSGAVKLRPEKSATFDFSGNYKDDLSHSDKMIEQKFEQERHKVIQDFEQNVRDKEKTAINMAFHDLKESVPLYDEHEDEQDRKDRYEAEKKRSQAQDTIKKYIKQIDVVDANLERLHADQELEQAKAQDKIAKKYDIRPMQEDLGPVSRFLKWLNDLFNNLFAKNEPITGKEEQVIKAKVEHWSPEEKKRLINTMFDNLYKTYNHEISMAKNDTQRSQIQSKYQNLDYSADPTVNTTTQEARLIDKEYQNFLDPLTEDKIRIMKAEHLY